MRSATFLLSLTEPLTWAIARVSESVDDVTVIANPVAAKFELECELANTRTASY